MSYFQNFDRLVMRDFVADVLDAYEFVSRIMSVKVNCSTSERFALALELVRITYECDMMSDFQYRFAEAYRIMIKAKHQFNMTSAEFGRFMRTRYDVQAFAAAALDATLDVSTN